MLYLMEDVTLIYSFVSVPTIYYQPLEDSYQRDKSYDYGTIAPRTLEIQAFQQIANHHSLVYLSNFLKINDPI